MGVLQNALGMNLTNHDPLIDSPYNNGGGGDASFPPPGSDRMITETGIYMITETTLAFMDTE
jgi:hypothetical protein